MAERRLLRPAGFDDLGLRRALGDRILPLLVAAMAFLAALALAGAAGAAALARYWQEGAAAALTVQVPDPAGVALRAPSAPGAAPAQSLEGARLARVLAMVRGTPGVAAARALDSDELAELLKPWLGPDARRFPLPMPAVLEVHVSGEGPGLPELAARLAAVAPGTLVESHGVWTSRLSALARSLQACSWAALLVVASVAVAVVTVATRFGLAARRDAIEIVHGLGASDGYIARRFADRATRLAALGGVCGALAATPMLLGLAHLASPFVPNAAGMVEAASNSTQPTVAPAWAWTTELSRSAMALTGALQALPGLLWLALVLLPLIAGAIGFVTAQMTVRRWLRRLP